MKTLVKKFVAEERGLETVEYAVIAALIVVGLMLSIAALGTAVKGKFDILTHKITTGGE